MSRNHRNRKRDGWIQKKRAIRDEYYAKHDEWYKEWYKSYFTLDDIVVILKAFETEGCVFELNAPQNIVDRLSVRPQGEWFLRPPEDLKNCFFQSAIYYPAEGIDRRAEYGMEVE